MSSQNGWGEYRPPRSGAPSSKNNYSAPTSDALCVAFRAALGACRFCGRLVEREELAAARHLAFACPSAPPEIRAKCARMPDVTIEQTPQEVLAANAERDRQSHIKSAAKNRAERLAKRRSA